MSRAPSRRQVTVEKNGTRGSANVVASSTGASRSAASAVSGLWKPARDLELDGAARAGRLGGGHERRDALERPAHDDLPGAVVVRGPDAVDAVAEALDLGIVEPDDGRHGTGRGRGRCGRRETALARQVRSGAVVDRTGRGQRGVLADRVADDVVRLQARCRQTGEARKLGRHERRLRDVGLAQALDRPLEAELGDVEPDRLRCALVDGPRGRKGLAHRTPHTHLLGTLSREAERHLALRHATSSQRPRTRLHRSPRRGPLAPTTRSGIGEPERQLRVQHASRRCSARSLCPARTSCAGGRRSARSPARRPGARRGGSARRRCRQTAAPGRGSRDARARPPRRPARAPRPSARRA